MNGSTVVAHQQVAPPEDRRLFAETQGAGIDALPVAFQDGLDHRAVVRSGNQYDAIRTVHHKPADQFDKILHRPEAGQHGLFDVPAAAGSQSDHHLFGANPVFLDKGIQEMVFPRRQIVMAFPVTDRFAHRPQQIQIGFPVVPFLWGSHPVRQQQAFPVPPESHPNRNAAQKRQQVERSGPVQHEHLIEFLLAQQSDQAEHFPQAGEPTAFIDRIGVGQNELVDMGIFFDRMQNPVRNQKGNPGSGKVLPYAFKKSRGHHQIAHGPQLDHQNFWVGAACGREGSIHGFGFRMFLKTAKLEYPTSNGVHLISIVMKRPGICNEKAGQLTCFSRKLTMAAAFDRNRDSAIGRMRNDTAPACPPPPR